jgi:lysophospholipase
MLNKLQIAVTLFIFLLVSCGTESGEPTVQAVPASLENFANKFNKVIRPFFEKNGKRGSFLGKENKRIAFVTFIQNGAKGDVYVFSGQGESYIKYMEFVFDMYRSGYNVHIMDWRGQGFSDRLVSSSSQVCYIDSFDYLIADMGAFIQKVPSTTGNAFVFAHSTGGAVVARYLENNPGVFKAAVLSAPLFGLNTGKTPLVAARLLAAAAVSGGKGADYIDGQGDWKFGPHSDGSGTSSEERHTLMGRMKQEPGNRISTNGGISYKWFHEVLVASDINLAFANSLKTPTLLFQASADKFVALPPQAQFCAKAGSFCKLEIVVGARHEIWREVDAYRVPQMRKMISFFDSHRN